MELLFYKTHNIFTNFLDYSFNVFKNIMIEKNQIFKNLLAVFAFLLSLFISYVSAEEHRKMKCLQQISISRNF